MVAIELPLSRRDGEPSEGGENEQGHHKYHEKQNTRQRARYLFSQTRSALFTLLPTWIQYFFLDNKEPTAPQPLRDTAWLDGMRGVAALFVSIYHYTYTLPYQYNNPFYLGPYPDDEGSATSWTSPFNFYIIRLVHSGQSMVPIFFVISGYVLSYRKVEQIRKKEISCMKNGLLSSAIRRPFRLFPVAIVVFFIWQVMNYCRFTPGFEPTESVLDIITQWLGRIGLMFTDVFRIDYRGPDIAQFWTIPIEFTDSLILFAAILALSWASTPLRIAIVSMAMALLLMLGFWALSLFFAGYLIAEAEAIFQARDNSKPTTVHNVIWSICWLLGLILASYPTNNVEHDYLLSWIPSITPQLYIDSLGEATAPKFLATTLAAPLVVWPIFRLPVLQSIFTTPFALYLGKLSYALYAVHYHVVWWTTDLFFDITSEVFGDISTSAVARLASIVTQVLLYEIIVLWHADVFWRLADIPSVTLAKKVDNWVRSISWSKMKQPSHKTSEYTLLEQGDVESMSESLESTQRNSVEVN